MFSIHIHIKISNDQVKRSNLHLDNTESLLALSLVYIYYNKVDLKNYVRMNECLDG